MSEINKVLADSSNSNVSSNLESKNLNVPITNNLNPEQISDKFPDPTQPAAESEVLTDSKKEVSVRSIFWRNVIVVLVVLPLITALGVGVYRWYQATFSQQVLIQTNLVNIDPNLVVTPESLPIINASSSATQGWLKYTNPVAKYQFDYPQEWTLLELNSEPNLQLNATTDPNSKIVIKSLATAVAVTNHDQLTSFIKDQDQNSAIRITEVSSEAIQTKSGLPIITRQIFQGSEQTAVPDTYIALDTQVIHLIIEGNFQIPLTTYRQFIQTVAVALNQGEVDANWKIYRNDFGYSFQYPVSIVLRSGDKNSSEVSKSTNIILFAASEIQNTSGFANSLEFLLTDTEPEVVASQSATRDFGEREFKVFDKSSETYFVGQLYSGNWLQVIQHYDSNIQARKLLSDVINTISPTETNQLP